MVLITHDNFLLIARAIFLRYSPPIQLFPNLHKTTPVDLHLSKLLGDKAPEHELKALSRHSRLIKTKEDGYICRQSELMEGIYILMSGSIKTTRTNQDNYPVSLHIQHSIQLINAGFLSGIREHAFSVKAQNECTTLVINLKPCELNNYPTLMNAFLKAVLTNANDLQNIIQSLLTQPLPERVVQKLHTIVHPETRRVYATQTDLAEMLGVSRQKVHAEIKQLVKNGSIKSGYGWFEIID